MRRAFLTLIISAAVAFPVHAVKASDSLIGLAAPLTGFAETLGRQLETGARLSKAAFITEDTACTEEGGTAAANRLADQKVTLVIGFLCTEALEAALPVLSNAGIPVISPGIRTISLTDRRNRTGYLFWRTAPRADSERNAAADFVVSNWRNEYIAIIDDGTIYGRELAETVRLRAELEGLKPVFVDTFRPQSPNQIAMAGRLKRAGATRVFAGGDREDIAILGRDLAKLDSSIIIAGGEALVNALSETQLRAGTLAISLPDMNRQIAGTSSGEIGPEGYVAAGLQAAEIAQLLLTQGKPDNAQGWHDLLDQQSFVTSPGTVRFDDKGDLADNPYTVMKFDGDNWEQVD